MRRHSIAGICISQPPVLCLTLGTGPQFVAVLAVLHLCLLRYFPCTNLVDRADNCYTSLVFTGPDPQFVFNGPGRQFVFTDLGPKFVFTDPGPKLLFTGPGQSGAWARIYQPYPPNLYLLALPYDFYYHALNLHLPSYL